MRGLNLLKSVVAVEMHATDAYSRLDVTTAKHITSEVNVVII
jgi:hypothetical protein